MNPVRNFNKQNGKIDISNGVKMMVRLGLTLTAICAVAGLGLSLTHQATEEKIAEIEAKKKKEAIFAVLPGTTSYTSEKSDTGKEFYRCFKDDRLIGYALPIQTNGYGGEIKIMLGVGLKGKISAIKILNHQETPGLGAKITEVRSSDESPWFTDQFKNKAAGDLNFDNIQAITGATISSRAVLESVKKTVEEFKKTLK